MASYPRIRKPSGLSSTPRVPSVRLAIVGDRGVGKSCFLSLAAPKSLRSEYLCGPFDDFRVPDDVMVDNSPWRVTFWDVGRAGKKEFEENGSYFAFRKTDVFVVCFDVGNRTSFQNVTSKWLPEVRLYVPEVPILLLGTKIDLRSDRNSDAATDRDMVSYQEGKACASDLVVSYAECSSLSGCGVQTVVNSAATLAVQFHNFQNRRLEKNRFFKRKIKQSSFVQDQEPPYLTPHLPPKDVAPQLEIMTSSFASDWCSIMADTSCTDVRFLFHDGQQIEAHRIVLSAACSIFKNIFLGRLCPQNEAYSQIFEDISWVCDEGSNCTKLVHVEEECKRKGKTVITLDRGISRGVFMEVLRFLYTGFPDIPEDDLDESFLQEIQVLAEKLQLSRLTEICATVKKGDFFLNPNLNGNWLNITGLMAKKLFLNKPLLSYVKFRVEGIVVYAHKAILRARCEVIAAMFSGGFKESDDDSEIEIQDASLQSFLALLEYLYTDLAPIEEGDPVEILVLADRFCLPRLVTLCELYITKRVDRSIRKRVADVASDVISLLLTSQAYNAMQLAQWCLHFISTNFSVFETMEEFSLVQGENREYVEEHRWPPLSYLKELEEYEKKVKISHPSAECIVM